MCGGNGLCLRASLTCECNVGYAGDACEYCEVGYNRQGQYCIPIIVKRRLQSPTPVISSEMVRCWLCAFE